ncbi:MAG: LysE family transporter, partial [Alphaproteobacteria bacterium]|nr:LysE family transporter [Alphaproteobacteria bacterium]
MELAVLAQIGAVCVLGAMSPGPSLAVVLRNTVAGGRLRGVMTGLGHGIGFFFYALIAVSGLAAAMDAGAVAARALQWGGAAVLVWLGWQFLQSDGVVADEHDSGGRE